MPSLPLAARQTRSRHTKEAQSDPARQRSPLAHGGVSQRSGSRAPPPPPLLEEEPTPPPLDVEPLLDGALPLDVGAPPLDVGTSPLDVPSPLEPDPPHAASAIATAHSASRRSSLLPGPVSVSEARDARKVHERPSSKPDVEVLLGPA